jgi:hypothetical protein
MGYTFKTYQTPNNLGPLAMDANKQAIQIAAGIQTQDAAGTPVVSPLAVPSGAPTTLSIPKAAVNLCVLPLTNSINISESDPTVATNYLTAPVGAITKIPCVRMATIYLKANTGPATGTSFWFEMV